MLKSISLAFAVSASFSSAAMAQQVLCQGENQIQPNGAPVLDATGRPVPCPSSTPGDPALVYILVGGVVVGVATALAVALSNNNNNNNGNNFLRPVSP